MQDFLDYDIKYPDLVLSIVEYFSISKGDINNKSVGDFVNNQYTSNGIILLQPEIVGKICDRLCDARCMSSLKRGTQFNFTNNYCCTFHDDGKYPRTYYIEVFNSIVYGFEYIYRLYKPRVLPLLAFIGEDQSMGSCFRLMNGVVTAKHCLTDGTKIAIKGYSCNELSKCRVLVSSNENIDLAFIETKEDVLLNCGEPHVLDDILVMGYPKIAWFANFCTCEKATISSKAELRMTPTIGAIAASEKMFFPRNIPEILLVTARIRGGNSGGPLINKMGLVVGIATGVPAGEGISDDDIGYGMAYPIQAIESIINDGIELGVNFVDYPDN